MDLFTRDREYARKFNRVSIIQAMLGQKDGLCHPLASIEARWTEDETDWPPGSITDDNGAVRPEWLRALESAADADDDAAVRCLFGLTLAGLAARLPGSTEFSLRRPITELAREIVETGDLYPPSIVPRLLATLFDTAALVCHGLSASTPSEAEHWNALAKDWEDFRDDALSRS